MIRLQKAIADRGYCSRRKAEELIQKGKVSVNGEIISELGTKVSEKDEIIVEGNVLSKQDKEYYLLYKPRGVISSVKDDKNRKTVVDFFPSNVRIYPIGRLDYDTSGILLLTNDGEFANLMMHPSSEIEKKYVAKLEGILTGLEIKKIKSGVIIDGFKCIPDRIKLKSFDKKNNTSIVEITIHEGKNHEVKRIFESIGLNVIKLKRETFGTLTLDGLKPGESRKLSMKEVKTLYSIIKRD